MLWDSVTSECCEVCHNCSRLLKNAIKMPPSSGAGQNNRIRNFARRPLSQNLFFGDKENCKSNSSANEDSHQPTIFPSPSKQISPSKYAVARNRHPLEDHDPNSQDSGYGTVNPDKEESKNSFRFTEPLGTAPRRLVDQSPRKDNYASPRKFVGNPPLFHSLSSSSGSESIDDGFMELFESDKMDEDAQLPSGLNSLLSGPLKVHGKISPLKENGINSPLKYVNKNENVMKSPEQRKHVIGRSLSFSGQRKQVRSCLFSSDKDENVLRKEIMSPGLEAIRSFKRPDPPAIISPLETKRRKSNSLHCISENQILSDNSVQGTLLSYGFERQTVKLQRSFSETEATIKSALQKASQQPDLIGDFSRPFVLPLMSGRHQDLKAISPDTLASLLNGNYKDSVDSFTIIDCRYPYEFDGGHIRGARNVYTKDQIWKEFVENKHCSNSNPSSKREILIFHCEFSSERGPSLSRFLRNCDRTQNKECYPSLNYPEVYLLDGGYKNFYEKHSGMCEPCSYQPMHDPKFESDLRKFRAKSKSWSGDNKTRLAYRSNLKRLGL